MAIAPKFGVRPISEMLCELNLHLNNKFFPNEIKVGNNVLYLLILALLLT
jgi:hypothetical protein